MTVLARMLSRMIVLRFCALLFGVCCFVIALEIIATLDDLLKKSSSHGGSLFEYALLLVPETASTFFLMALLLAVLLTLVELMGRYELPVVWASGVSPLQMMRFLIPLGIILGMGHFLLVDRLVPFVAPSLEKWGTGERALRALGDQKGGVTWMRSGQDIIRIGAVEEKGRVLKNVMVVHRDGAGLLKTLWIAPSAEFVEKKWVLRDVVVYQEGSVTPEIAPRLIYEGRMRPAVSGPRSGNPQLMTIEVLDDFITHAGYGVRPVYVYETWWHRRVSMVFIPLLLMAMCLPLATRFRRGGGAGRLLGLGIAIGFSFSILEGITLSMGEIGAVPPWAAGWTPMVIYTLLWGAIALHYEKV